jgi:hypothetical protein
VAVLAPLTGDDLAAAASLLAGEESALPGALQVALSDSDFHLLLPVTDTKAARLSTLCGPHKDFLAGWAVSSLRLIRNERSETRLFA